MKKNLKISLALLAAIMLVFAAGCDSSTRYGEVTVSTAAELLAWAASDDVLTTSCTLAADIELNGDWTPIGDSDSPYTATFDGAGHTISGLSFSSTTQCSGFFGVVGEGGAVLNLNLADVSIETDKRYIGAVAGRNYGTIEGCALLSGSVSSDTVSDTVKRVNANAGGIAGYNRGTIRGCSSTGSVAGSNIYVGGIVGYNFLGTVIACYSTADVTGASDNDIADGNIVATAAYAGGIAGYNNGSTAKITGCYYAGTISASSAGTGGIVGCTTANATIAACYWSSTSASDGVGATTTGEADSAGSTETERVTGSWSSAMTAMNAAIGGSGWQYADGSGNDVPLVLENTTS